MNTQGITARVETISPDDASVALDRCAHQRPLSRGLVARLVADILADRFVLNGEPVIFSSSGELLDGMHRMYAIYEAGIPVSTLVVRGVPFDAFSTINTGKIRSLSDMLKIQNGTGGKWTLPRLAAIVASMATNGSSMGTVGATMADMLRARRLYSPGLEKFEDLAFVASSTRVLPSVAVGGVIAAVIVDSKSSRSAREFLTAVNSGIADDPRKSGSSAITLRNWLLTSPVSGSGVRGSFYRKSQRAFKAWLTGETWTRAHSPEKPIWDVSVGSPWWGWQSQ